MEIDFRMYYGADSSPTWIAYQYNKTANSHYVMNLKGWDEDETFTLNTAPKLIEPGSYVISSSIDERSVELTVNSVFSNAEQIRNFRRNLTNQMLSGTQVKMERTFYTPGTSVLKIETLYGYIVSMTGWEQIVNNVSFTIAVRCVDPTIEYSSETV